MKILFDVITPPDALLFSALAEELKEKHEILFSTHTYSENIQLLQKRKFSFYVIKTDLKKGFIQHVLTYAHYALAKVPPKLRRNWSLSS